MGRTLMELLFMIKECWESDKMGRSWEMRTLRKTKLNKHSLGKHHTFHITSTTVVLQCLKKVFSTCEEEWEVHFASWEIRFAQEKDHCPCESSGWLWVENTRSATPRQRWSVTIQINLMLQFRLDLMNGILFIFCQPLLTYTLPNTCCCISNSVCLCTMSILNIFYKIHRKGKCGLRVWGVWNTSLLVFHYLKQPW